MLATHKPILYNLCLLLYAEIVPAIFSEQFAVVGVRRIAAILSRYMITLMSEAV